jgi:hypothetical protein
MLIGNDVRRAVCFIGTYSGQSFQSHGTGFIMAYKGVGYVITARHVVAELQDMAFAIRINLNDGGVAALHHDQAIDARSKWFFLDDSSVDIAACVMDGTGSITTGGLMADWILTDELAKNLDIGVGDVCYTVGLFRLFAGEDRNLPVVHTGNIALLAGEQRIPVTNGSKISFSDSHLVEQTSLNGLSGAPVFVRPTIMSDVQMKGGGSRRIRVGDSAIKLLGVWQAAWEGVPTEFSGRQVGMRVAVGIGAVVPAKYILALLESSDVVNDRTSRLADGAADSA